MDLVSSAASKKTNGKNLKIYKEGCRNCTVHVAMHYNALCEINYTATEVAVSVVRSPTSMPRRYSWLAVRLRSVPGCWLDLGARCRPSRSTPVVKLLAISGVLLTVWVARAGHLMLLRKACDLSRRMDCGHGLVMRVLSTACRRVPAGHWGLFYVVRWFRSVGLMLIRRSACWRVRISSSFLSVCGGRGRRRFRRL